MTRIKKALATLVIAAAATAGAAGTAVADSHASGGATFGKSQQGAGDSVSYRTVEPSQTGPLDSHAS
ncbi:hypothetical protein [Streptomyces sp. H27-D2]|uniref:hypothetical protein n=1 Tax=Streptomyces sp. H27-D2 TaxID=3046304 RepID=UPI002DC05CA5|nr:hypothetical protein [Streptomyces sp. H27-D2]MEC4015339.1 hypothetical protein [Streptomyces sp. H27-D2]